MGKKTILFYILPGDTDSFTYMAYMVSKLFRPKEEGKLSDQEVSTFSNFTSRNPEKSLLDLILRTVPG